MGILGFIGFVGAFVVDNIALHRGAAHNLKYARDNAHRRPQSYELSLGVVSIPVRRSRSTHVDNGGSEAVEQHLINLSVVHQLTVVDCKAHKTAVVASQSVLFFVAYLKSVRTAGSTDYEVKVITAVGKMRGIYTAFVDCIIALTLNGNNSLFVFFDIRDSVKSVNLEEYVTVDSHSGDKEVVRHIAVAVILKNKGSVFVDFASNNNVLV